MTVLDVTELVSDDWQLDDRAYTDASLFARELRQIFETSWVYLAHESEVPEPGAYKATEIGIQPVLVTRGADDGELHVLLNRCRHRGAAVCQRRRGSANVFRCAYHGWTYSNNGDLIGVPFRDGYGPDFRKEDHGLVRVPRVGSHCGFVFASLAPDGPTLEEHLGPAAGYLERIANLGPEGIELSAGMQRTLHHANWKLQVENTVDPYHVAVVHKSFLDIQARQGSKADWLANVKGNLGWKGLDLGNGHSAHEFGESLDLGLGDLPFNLVVFPNLGFSGVHLRVVKPVNVGETVTEAHPIVLRNGDPEVNRTRLRQHEAFYGPAGFGTPDDDEIAFDRVRRGLRATGGRSVLLARGLHREGVRDDGVREARSSDEVPIRALYREWLRALAPVEREAAAGEGA